jgi:hypothetical protein
MLASQDLCTPQRGLPGRQVAGPVAGPLPAGSLVKGTIGDLSIGHCRHHLWQIGQAVPSTWTTGSGWLQPATCLVCEYTTAPMDCEWWQEPATQADIARTAQGVLTEMGRLRKVYESLTARLSGGQVQDMGMANFE